jgi:hypothetical protein
MSPVLNPVLNPVLDPVLNPALFWVGASKAAGSDIFPALSTSAVRW